MGYASLMSAFSTDDVSQLAGAVINRARALSLRIVTVESCTGGLVSAALTDVAGASDVLECGLVTYSNESKTALAGVPEDLIAAHGAVSQEVALAMTEGTLTGLSRADVAVAVTGIAGPGGATATKPVGLVHFGCARRGHPSLHTRHVFGGLDRSGVRHAAVLAALRLLLEAMAADQGTGARD